MADGQLEYRLDEILRISQNLITAVGEIRETQNTHTGILELHSRKFESIESDVSTLKDDVSTLKGDVSTLKCDVSTLNTGQKQLEGMLTDALYKIIELQNRMDKVEKHLANHNKRFDSLESKVESINTELSKISNKVDNIAVSQKEIKELEKRVEKIEEEVFA